MRKIFLIALMVALVPFATGCRIDGLWGFNDNSGTTVGGTTTTTTTANNVVLNANVSLPAANISQTGSNVPNGNIYEKDIFIVIGGVQIGPFSKDGQPNYRRVSGLNWLYNFWKLTTKSLIKFTTGTTASLQVWAGANQIATGSITVSDQVTNGGSTATNTYGITLTSTNGVWGVSVTYTDPTGAQTSPTQPTQVTSLTIESLGYATGTVYAPLIGATDVPYTSPTIQVTFNTLAANATTTFSVGFTNAKGNVATLTQADLGTGLSVTDTSTTAQTILNFTLIGANAGKLLPGTQYTATFSSSSAVRKDDSTKALVAPAAFSFTTIGDLLNKWDALNASGVSVKTSSTSTVASTASQIVLTFDVALASTIATDIKTATFNKTVGTASQTALLYSTYFQTPSVDSTGKIVTVPLISGKMLSVGAYSVSFGTGSLKDANGNAVDTTKTITFTVN